MSTKIAAAQFCATNDISNNLKICQHLISQAKRSEHKGVFFPEASDFIASTLQESFDLVSKNESGFIAEIKKTAKEEGIWVGIGVHEKSDKSDKLFNSYVLISNEGNLVSTYQKVHLFDVDIKDGPSLKESAYTKSGSVIHTPTLTPFGTVGLAICYDIRFPELAQTLRSRGAQIITYPSVFTLKTGQAHWETLIRARAIESQCYVIAPGQVGSHNAKRKSYGHTMIVDPWGTIVSTCGDQSEPSLCSAEVSFQLIDKVRNEMPISTHRRPELY